MSEPDWKALYGETFANLGVALEPGDGCSEEEISAAERRLRARLPAAVRSYFLLSGRELRVNQAHNQLLSPDDWFVDAGQLVFLAENQAVVLWGVALTDANEDPPIFQGVNGDAIEWYAEHPRSSEFLQVMIHWQAVMGAFGRTWSAVVGADFPTRLTDWTCAGEVNGMRAYSRGAVALCWLPWDDGWRAFASSIQSERIEELAKELSLGWDPDWE